MLVKKNKIKTYEKKHNLLIKHLSNFFYTKSKHDLNVILEKLLKNDISMLEKGILISHDTVKVNISRILFQLKNHNLISDETLKLIYKKEFIKFILDNHNSSIYLSAEDLNRHRSSFKKNLNLLKKGIDIDSFL